MGIKPLLLLTLGFLISAGCSESHHHPRREPPPPVVVEPAPAGYVYYYDPGYYGGYYDRDYWYWHDRGGRMHREIRQEHERHLAEHPRYEDRGRFEEHDRR